jgi:hypothetical protein
LVLFATERKVVYPNLVYCHSGFVERMSALKKAKINLKEGTIELKGSEDFVSKQLESFQKQIQTIKLPD